MTNSAARRRHGFSSALQLCCVALSTILLQCAGVQAQGTLAAAIWNQYRAAPVLPFMAFDPESTTAALPGSTIGNISQRTFDGVVTYDLSAATICAAQNFSYPKLRGTQGFRQIFPVNNDANKSELRLLFGFDDEALSAIRAYEVTISSARFLTIPYDQLLTVKAQTSQDANCAGAPRPLKTISKPILANIDVIFRLTRPFSPATAGRLHRDFAAERPKGDNLEFRVSMPQKLVALGTIE